MLACARALPTQTSVCSALTLFVAVKPASKLVSQRWTCQALAHLFTNSPTCSRKLALVCARFGRAPLAREWLVALTRTLQPAHVGANNQQVSSRAQPFEWLSVRRLFVCLSVCLFARCQREFGARTCTYVRVCVRACVCAHSNECAYVGLRASLRETDQQPTMGQVKPGGFCASSPAQGSGAALLSAASDFDQVSTESEQELVCCRRRYRCQSVSWRPLVGRRLPVAAGATGTALFMKSLVADVGVEIKAPCRLGRAVEHERQQRRPMTEE